MIRRPSHLRQALLFYALGAALSCGGSDTTAPTRTPASVEVTPARGFAVGAGTNLQFTARVLDSAGQAMAGVGVTWRTGDAAVVAVSGDGLVTAVATGTTTLTADAGTVSGSAAVEVWVAPKVETYQPGASYRGRGGYVEYIPGELPVVISAPHGGSLEPAEIPDRTQGTTVTDSNTRETVAAVRQALIDATGKAPHVILSHLRRTKLDPNREIVEAAQGNPYAELAWGEFQDYIDVATAQVRESFGSGFYIDLHGHGHPIARAELGYLLSAAQLNGTDAALDQGNAAGQSSIRALADASPLPFSKLLRGDKSLGAYLAARGVRSVPSPSEPGPGAEPYFTGGYNTERHGSQLPGRTVSGVQIELPLPGTRDTEANRQAFGRALAEALEAYMTEHFGFFRPTG